MLEQIRLLLSDLNMRRENTANVAAALLALFQNPPSINRIEVIDDKFGRLFTEHLGDVTVTLDLQDNERTLKIFVKANHETPKP